MVTFLVTSCVTLLTFIGESQGHDKLDWRHTSLIYQIYPLSFKDSDGNGYGDLQGIYEKLDYVKDLGVDVIWIQPFYKSPLFDMGYDVTDYKSVDPLFGTMDDFQELVKGIHDRGMKLLLDFVPNHSSDLCEWFQLSLKGVEPYKDYYIYKDAKKVNDTHYTYPNNWRSLFSGSAWTWREERKQYSYNQFSPQQPELNLRNPNLLKELEDALKFWLDMGVDGFRVDAARHFFEATHLQDEPSIPGANFQNDWMNVKHIYTMDLPESNELIKTWSAFFSEYGKKHGQTKAMTVEAYCPPSMLKKYLGNDTHPGADVPYYMLMVYHMHYQINASRLNDIVHEMIDNFPQGHYNWVLDNHDNPRISTRYNPESVDSYNIFTLLLPGVASVYFGSELGMEDSKVRSDQGRDPNNAASSDPSQSRDGPRGFTTAKKPWLPVNPNYYRKNAKTQQENPNSHLNIFKRIVKLRKTPVIQHGDFQTFVHKDWIYLFTRSYNSETIAVVMNLGSETEDVCPKTSAAKLPETMFVHTSSIHSGLKIGSKVKTLSADETDCVQLRPFATVVLSTSDAVLTSFSVFTLLLTVCLVTVV
ncbi:unnamed protein product [Bemisia tabaci]|uniref:alpha-glucosidase n=1 Tax=Bemisia tabaci TaxID=7038 RepID=A0A9P0F7K0_BEMTA|nr:unnamed protein product [Bemisia tabaci]